MFLTNKLKQAGKKTLPFLLTGALLSPLNAQNKSKEKRDWLYHGLEVSYVALNVSDHILTSKLIREGEGKEINPALRYFEDDEFLSGLYRAGMAGVFLYGNRKIKRKNPKLAYGFLIAGNLLYSYLNHHNYQLSLKLNLK